MRKDLQGLPQEGKVEAMQLKLFIEILVLQKHEKLSQIQSGGQKGL